MDLCCIMQMKFQHGTFHFIADGGSEGAGGIGVGTFIPKSIKILHFSTAKRVSTSLISTVVASIKVNGLDPEICFSTGAERLSLLEGESGELPELLRRGQLASPPLVHGRPVAPTPLFVWARDEESRRCRSMQ